jgi:hypothetical protein
MCFENFESSTLKLPLDTQTAWRQKKGGFHNLGSLWCCINDKDKSLGDQMRITGDLGIQIVTKLDQREVINFFTGIKNESEMIDIQMRT